MNIEDYIISSHYDASYFMCRLYTKFGMLYFLNGYARPELCTISFRIIAND